MGTAEKIILTNKVYLEACGGYEEEPMRKVLFRLLSRMISDNGFSEDFRGKTVLIKPNLLSKYNPDEGVTTNPAQAAIAAEYFISKGARVTIADSPGGLYRPHTLSAVYNATGMTQAAAAAGAELNCDCSFERVSGHGFFCKDFHIITPVLKCDLVVNLCRLKTHALCAMSAAVKNMFGCVPGLQKAEFHAKFPKRDHFAGMLVDLCLVCAPRINIVDCITAMEGNGPSGGTPRHMGAIAAGVNPFALDLLCSGLMGYSPDEVGTVAQSVKRGLCPDNASRLEVVGEDPKRYASRFLRPDSSAGGLLRMLPLLYGGRVREWLGPRPAVNPEKCVGCGECAKCCPVEAIDIADDKAYIRKDHCIRCYCCQELCPVRAIDIRRNFLYRL